MAKEGRRRVLSYIPRPCVLIYGLIFILLGYSFGVGVPLGPYEERLGSWLFRRQPVPEAIVVENPFGPSLAGPYACLRKTTPKLKLRYPSDAVAHTAEINEALRNWTTCVSRHGCIEKFTETHWMAQYNLTELISDPQGGKLRNAFGPYIPLLVPWTELWVKHGHYFPKGLMTALYGVLRKDVPYVTVSQGALGLAGRCTEGFNHRDFPGLLVLSAGGYGHVPIPLMKPPVATPFKVSDSFVESKYLTSFLGTSTTAPAEFRKKVCSAATSITRTLNHGHFGHFILSFFGGKEKRGMEPKFRDSRAGNGSFMCIKRDDWRAVGFESRASLCPRGSGRTSFRMAETIQMGLIPIYVYDDHAWVPYPEKWADIGWVTNLAGLRGVLAQLYHMPLADVSEMRRKVLAFRDSHYTMPKVLEQISAFIHWDPAKLNSTRGDLRCVRLPSCPQQDDIGCERECRWE